MKLETFATMRALESAHTSTNQFWVDKALDSESGEEVRENLKLKRLQFDCAPSLHEEVENICLLLNCSKREFLEMAVRDSLEKAQDTFLSTYAETTGHDFGIPTEGEA